MAFGQNSHGADRFAMVAGGNGGGGGYQEEDEEESNPLLMIGGTLGVFAVLFVAAYFVLGPVLYKYSSDTEPVGHKFIGLQKFDFSPIFDLERVPAHMRAAVAEKCGEHVLDEGVDARKVNTGYSLTAYSRAVSRVHCTLSLPKQNFCSSDATQYAVDLIVAYDAVRGSIAGLNKSVQNLSQSLGGSVTLMFNKVENEISKAPISRIGADGKPVEVKKKPLPSTSDTVLRLKRSPFPGVFDPQVAQAVGGLSEEGHIFHSQFPDYGLMMPVTIANALKTQVYSPNCG